jgi:prepilin-type N-terminal cleavage/methylation domain-containing protein
MSISRSPGVRTAFTLVEILVVVVILGICAAIIVPQIGHRDDLATVSMARTIVADLSYAQSLAVSTQRRHFVRFDLTNNRYDLLDQMTPSEQIITQPVNLTQFRVQLGSARKDNLKDVMLDDVTFDTQTVLMFDELGTPHAYNPTSNTSTALVAGSIRLKSHAYTLTITVEPYSGELRVN